MSYLVLARKYRPQTFDEVVKQEHVTRTLAHAIEADRVAHAILFAGPRGTGKTTIARILAKAVNCEQGPAPTPCNECRSCKEITAGGAADVFEIDGASNNGVDHIRELRENSKYLPAHSRQKIYIIDEVHMLSTPAFNALLKTLEEPPPHVMFLFATTEPHKIPITILSRCQRHDLRRVDTRSLHAHLEDLCRREGVVIDDESLWLVAREADGSVRDSLSLLDQVLTFADDAVTHAQVLDLLGVVDRKVLFDISEAVLNSDAPAILDLLEKLYEYGHNLKALYGDIIEHFRNLLLVKMGKGTAKLVDLPDHELEWMAKGTAPVTEIYLGRLVDLLLKEETSVRFSAQPRVALEMVFIRMLQVKPMLPIDSLIEKIDALRQNLPAADAAPARISHPREAVPAEVDEVDDASADTVPAQKDDVQREDDADLESDLGYGSQWGPEDLEDAAAGSGDLVPRVRPDDGFGYEPGEPPERVWEKLVEKISATSRPLGACLGKCALKSLEDGRIEILTSGGNTSSANRIQKNSDIIREACREFFSREMELVIKADGDYEAAQKGRFETTELLKKEALEHPLVAAAIEIFEGKVTDIQVLENS